MKNILSHKEPVQLRFSDKKTYRVGATVGIIEYFLAGGFEIKEIKYKENKWKK
tara:strand:+ start:2430 stop:2588 length:159 start_codon:yes stop_codon:yes gene_type:complete